MKKNQKGFALVEGILIVVALALIGGVGFYVVNANKENNKQPNSSITTEQDSKTTEAEATTYVEIKEWGVRFPQTSSGKYSVKLSQLPGSETPQTTFGGPADLEAQALQVTGFSQEENKCTLPYDAGSIYRHKDQNPVIEYQGTHNLETKAQIKIGDWWYSTSGLDSTSNCFDGLAVSDEYKTFTTKFLEDFKKIQKIE